MTDTTKHTPTPWNIHAGDRLCEIFSSGPYDDDAIAFTPHRQVPGTNKTASPLPADYANAAHIVHCVNHHDELVAALEEAASIIECWKSSTAAQVAAQRARAVLAKVEQS